MLQWVCSCNVSTGLSVLCAEGLGNQVPVQLSLVSQKAPLLFFYFLEDVGGRAGEAFVQKSSSCLERWRCQHSKLEGLIYRYLYMSTQTMCMVFMQQTYRGLKHHHGVIPGPRAAFRETTLGRPIIVPKCREIFGGPGASDKHIMESRRGESLSARTLLAHTHLRIPGSVLSPPVRAHGVSSAQETKISSEENGV